MAQMIALETQGISDDWCSATGAFEPKLRGQLTKDQVLSAMQCLAPLQTPDTPDPCPPHIQTDGAAGRYSFVGQGGAIYCADVDQNMTPSQATDMAFGVRIFAPPPPTSKPASPAPMPAPAHQSRKYGWKGRVLLLASFGAFFSTFVVLANGMALREADGPTAAFNDAMTTGTGLAILGILLWVFARKTRKAHYYNSAGARVEPDGTALQYMMMGSALTAYDDDTGDADADASDDGDSD